MNRPAGVTVSAAFLIIGSVLTALMGVLMLFSDSLVPLETPQPESARTWDVIAAVVLFAGAVWGLGTSVGLLRMRHWARVCISVIGAILMMFWGLLLLMCLFLPGLIPPLESDEESRIVIGIIISICLIPIAAGIWWLIYFNRAAVKVAFLEVTPTPEGPQRPLSITIIAWHAIVFGLGTLAFLVMRSTPYVLGIALTGWAADLVNLALATAELAIGVGLLKLKPWGHTAAVWFCIFVMVNALVSAFLSDQDPRVAAFIQQLAVDLRVDFTPPPWSLWIGPVVVWGTFGVALWYLLTRKNAFLEAGKASQSPA